MTLRDRLPAPGFLAAIAIAMLSLAACKPSEPEPPEPQARAVAVDDAPETPELRGADADAEPLIGRAAPPMLQPVVLGDFIASDDPAKDGTGALKVEDGRIVGANGAEFVTERIAVIRAGDEYARGARYADVLMVGAEQPVELRRVVQEIAPKAGTGTAFCGARPTGYLALARVVGADGREALRLVALQGEDVPAASSGTHFCRSAQYLASL